jgi:hypothetical protein
MDVLNLALGPDTGGQGIRMKHAFDRYAPGWSFRSMVSTPNYMHYPIDVRYRPRVARKLYEEADVIHLRNRLDGHRMFDDGQGKPTVLHHHGTHFRTHHESLAYEARRIGAVQIVSTVDLELLEPDTTWVPAPFDLAELRRIRAAHYRPSDVIRIAHAPTNRAVKGTAEVLAAIASLSARNRIEFDLIEHRPWAECLERKARADIFIDQLALGYGCNAIEAWAMGIPVVAGVADPKVRSHMLSRWSRLTLPFAEATPRTLAGVLEGLIRDRDAREFYAAAGTAQVEQFHDERVVVDQLKGIYAAAPATKGHVGPARSVRYARPRPRWTAGGAVQ